VLTSRGCPYSCDFCFNSLGRRSIRYRSAENVLEEIAYLVRRYQVDYISFLDESFLTNERHVHEICDGLRRANWSLQWGFAARSTSLTPDILTDVKEAGCDYIYLGIDSGSEQTLTRMKKQTTVEDNFRAFCLTVEAGIYPVPNMIIGYDNETMDNIEEDYRFLARLIEYGRALRNRSSRRVFERGFNNFGAIYFATPYPGSELYFRNRHRLPPLGQILHRISGRDAYELTVNVSSIPDQRLLEEQRKMEDFVRRFTL
jgi:radical SAM superfamily enzyme YgiQ (UPF0313 family)